MGKPRGRPPVPDEIKRAKGTDQPCRLRGAIKIDAETELPKPPTYLGSIGKEEWNRLVPSLDKLGLLAKTDYSALASLCLMFQTWVELAAQDKIINGAKGPMVNPAFWAAQKAHSAYLEMVREFGLTPVSRIRLAGSIDKEKPKDPVGDLMKKKTG